MGFLRAYRTFLVHHKAWYLVPIAVILVTLVVLLFLFRTRSETPFVYTPF